MKRARGGSVKPFASSARRGADWRANLGISGSGSGRAGSGHAGVGAAGPSGGGGAHLAGELLEDHGEPIGDGERFLVPRAHGAPAFGPLVSVPVVRPRASPGLPAAGRVASVRTSLACLRRRESTENDRRPTGFARGRVRVPRVVAGILRSRLTCNSCPPSAVTAHDDASAESTSRRRSILARLPTRGFGVSISPPRVFHGCALFGTRR